MTTEGQDLKTLATHPDTSKPKPVQQKPGEQKTEKIEIPAPIHPMDFPVPLEQGPVFPDQIAINVNKPNSGVSVALYDNTTLKLKNSSKTYFVDNWKGQKF